MNKTQNTYFHDMIITLEKCDSIIVSFYCNLKKIFKIKNCINYLN